MRAPLAWLSVLSGPNHRRLIIALAAATIAQVGLSVWFAVTTDQDHDVAVELVAVLVIGCSFAGTGLFAWWMRPTNIVGALTWLTGFFWFFNLWTLAEFVPAFVAGFAFANASFGFLIHVLLAFPEGRLETRLERSVVTGGYLAVLPMQLVAVFLVDPAHVGCEGCPANPLLLVENQGIYDAFSAVQSLLGIAVLVGLVVALVRRWRRWTEKRRRQFTPVLWAGGLSLSLIAIQIAIDLAGVPERVRQVTFLVALVPFAVVPFAFLAGLLRGRISRAEAVGDLVAQLSDHGEGTGLRDAIADALSDPTVELVYWLPDSGGYVNANGEPVALPEDVSRWAQVSHRDRCVGAIVHDRRLQDDQDLVTAVASAAGLRMENERLDAELRARLEELRASRARIVEAGYRERRRVERDLHDGAQQRLMALALNLKLARSKLDQDPAEAGELLDEATAELEQATAELRELARGIHPGLLTDRGLVPALEALASRAPVPVELSAQVAQRPAPGVEAATYFLVSEALANVAKHSGAERATVRVAQENASLTIEVSDDGSGGADPSGSGLQGLADRVAALDGRFSVTNHDGGGTVVRASIPLG